VSPSFRLHGRAAIDVVRSHPRHLVLAGLVGGMLAGHAATPVIVAAALAAGMVGGVSLSGGLAAAAVIAGAGLAQERMDTLAAGPLDAMVRSHVSGAAVVLEPPRVRGHGGSSARVRWLGDPGRGEVALARLPHAPSDASQPMPTAPAAELAVGSIVRVSARVSELEPWEEFQRRRGARVALEVDALRVTGHRPGPAGWLDRVRERGREGLRAAAHSGDAAVLRGMVLGEDHAIAESVRDEFERSGLAHLLAVSGQNVMLLSVLVLAVGASVGLPLSTRLAMALALVVLYVPLTGAGPSIQRAGVMGAAGLVAALAGRPTSRWYALLLAAAVTLAANPHALSEPAWQLSFASVIGLLAGAARFSGVLTRRGCPRPLAEVMALTMIATVATAPLLAHHFGELSLVSLPANVMAAPAVAPVMWLGMLAIAVAQVDAWLAAPLAAVAAPLVAYIEWVAHVAAGPRTATLSVNLSWPLGVLGAYGGMAIVCWASWALARSGPAAALRRRASGASARARWLAATAGCALVALLAGPVRSGLYGETQPPPAAGELVVSFLDVGQGDATLLRTDGAALLFDTGPPDGPILERLEEAGVRRLDALVLTHAQADHEGAALRVIAQLRPHLVLNGGAGWSSPVQAQLRATARAAGSRVVDARVGRSLRVDGISVDTLWPPPLRAAEPSGDPNQRALVAHVWHGTFDLLLPADAESDVLAHLDLPRAEAMKVSHHGSEDLGLPAVLDRVQPSLAAIEVGRGNSYGHPARSTLEALQAVKHVARTDRDGTVTVRVRGDRMSLGR